MSGNELDDAARLIDEATGGPLIRRAAADLGIPVPPGMAYFGNGIGHVHGAGATLLAAGMILDRIKELESE